jgi:hypothetical protein
LSINSLINSSIGNSPYLLIYKREAKTEFNNSEDNTLDFVQRRIDLYQEAIDVVKLAQARIKIYYNAKHIAPLDFGSQVYLRLSKKNKKEYYLEN